jgi:hypothetical protein
VEPFDNDCAGVIYAHVNPVMVAADVDFRGHGPNQVAMLWEADPNLFVTKYPSSGVRQMWGENWPPSSVDWWLHVVPEENAYRLDVAGWNLPDVWVRSSGVMGLDAVQLAALMARLLDEVHPGSRA